MGCDEISADWAAQRIKGLDLRTAIIDGVRRSLGWGKRKARDGTVVKTLIESFRYPRRGPGMMWEEAARKIRGFGGHMLMDRKVDGLTYDAKRAIWTVSALRANGTRETFTARHVVSSAPLRELAEALSPKPISLFQARSLQYRDFLTVALIAKTDRTFPDNWVYIHDPSVLVGRVQNFRSWSPEMVPDEGHTLPWPGVFLLRGGRALDHAGSRTRRACRS
jgi:protoporphyrinogen oxidase